MNIEKLNDAFKVKIDFNRDKKHKTFLMLSDLHFDSKKCNRKGLKKLMDEAVETDSGIMLFGDLLDVMGAKYDPRSGKEDIRPEYNSSNYFQLVVDDLVEFLKPYKKNLIFISKGNHEDSVKRRHEFDLMAILEYKMRMEYGWEGVMGGYEGWIMFSGQKVGNKGDRQKSTGTIKAYYTHGSGGNAPVTRGVISTSRRQVQINADMFISGHIHTQWAIPIPQRKISDMGVEYVSDIVHLQLGCFKESHRGSWEAQKGFGAANIGGYWVKFYYDSEDKIRVVETRTMI